MLTFDQKDFCLFITEEFFAEMKTEYELDNEMETLHYLVQWLRTGLRLDEYLHGEYRTYIDRYAVAKGLTKQFAVFFTHGHEENGQWMYDNKGKSRTVQSWVKANDGKFACIACYLCNPGMLTVKTKKSLLLLPDRIIGGIEQSNDIDERFHLTLIHPKEGDVDGYTLDYHLRKLQTT